MHSNSSWLAWAEIDWSVYVALPKQPIHQFGPVRQSRQKRLRAYCPNIYTVDACDHGCLCSAKNTSKSISSIMSMSKLMHTHDRLRVIVWTAIEEQRFFEVKSVLVGNLFGNHLHTFLTSSLQSICKQSRFGVDSKKHGDICGSNRKKNAFHLLKLDANRALWKLINIVKV